MLFGFKKNVCIEKCGMASYYEQNIRKWDFFVVYVYYNSYFSSLYQLSQLPNFLHLILHMSQSIYKHKQT